MKESKTEARSLIGLLSGRPVRGRTAPDPAADDLPADAVALVNLHVRPPIPLTAGDIHVRTIRLISAEVNDHGGRFPADEHGHLCRLLIDTPVLIGHDRSGLPVARNFDARCVNDAGGQWVEVSFYWLRSPFGDRLAADIDGGVVKEGSIGFEFNRPQCGICGRDIRRCEHIPNQEYDDPGGGLKTAHYEYRDIVRVLETSLVYRGATPGTHFVRDGRLEAQRREHPRHRHHLCVVLDHCRTGHGRHEYLVALRDPDDPAVCDETTIVSTEKFAIGEHLILHDGIWSPKPLSARAPVNRVKEPCHQTGDRSQNGVRQERNAAMLKRAYGVGARAADSGRISGK